MGSPPREFLRSPLVSALWPLESLPVIRTLRAVDFRCFSSLGLEIPEGGAVFTGDNAQGKTSILEAVCVLVRLHSVSYTHLTLPTTERV